MVSFTPAAKIGHRGALLAILAVAALVRLYHLNAPLLEGSTMSVKEVFCANKARSIAGPPLALLDSSFDFLDRDGHLMEFIG